MHLYSLPELPIRDGYVLVDASNLSAETFDTELPMHRCTPASLTNADALMPRLIDVAALSEAQQASLTDSVRRDPASGRPPAICAWLESDAAAKTVIDHISRYLVGRNADGVQVLWRYYDPRVFSFALHIMSPAQREALLGPVHEWRFAWCAHWWRVCGAGVVHDPLEGMDAVWPTQEQWLRFEHADLVNRALIQLTGSVVLPETDCLHFQKRLDTTFRYAKRHLRLSDDEDLMAYGMHCMRYGEAFLRNEKLAPRWNEIAQGNLSWSSFLALLDPADYKEMASEAKYRREVMGEKV